MAEENFKRRKDDEGLYLSGFRDVSKVTVMLLLAIIAYFLKDMGDRFKTVETTMNQIQITIAQVEVRDLANEATRQRLENEIKYLKKKMGL